MRTPAMVVIAGFLLAGTCSAATDSLQMKLKAAQQAYANASYQEAAATYESLIADGYHDARLYYNLGGAYFKQGRLGASILNFERAFRIDPADPAIEHNLNVARSRIRDRVEPIPLLFLVQWWNDVKSEHSVETLFLLSVALAWILAAMLFIFFGFKNVLVRRVALAMGILVAVLFASSVMLVFDKNAELSSNDHGIIMPVEAVVVSAPDRSGVESFKIHEGLKVAVLESKGGMLRIRLQDGKEGWVDENALVRI